MTVIAHASIIKSPFGEERSTIKVINKTWRSEDDNCLLESTAYLRFDCRPTRRCDSWIFTTYGDPFVPICCIYLSRNS